MLKALWIALFSFAVTVETGTAQTTALDVTARLAPAKPIKGSVCLSRNCTAGLRSIRTGSCVTSNAGPNGDAQLYER